MFDSEEKTKYFARMQALIKMGIENKNILQFDEVFYQKMSHTYFCGLPVSMDIKYLNPSMRIKKCYERSLSMFLCFDDAILVRGDTKELEFKNGKEYAGHGWIEIGEYAYDPTSLCKYQKDIYYEIYCPTNVQKTNKEDYLIDNREFYEDIKNTTLEDFLKGGRKRFDLLIIIPWILLEANKSQNEDFKRELSQYLISVDYDEKQISRELKMALEKENH